MPHCCPVKRHFKDVLLIGQWEQRKKAQRNQVLARMYLMAAVFLSIWNTEHVFGTVYFYSTLLFIYYLQISIYSDIEISHLNSWRSYLTPEKGTLSVFVPAFVPCQIWRVLTPDWRYHWHNCTEVNLGFLWGSHPFSLSLSHGPSMTHHCWILWANQHAGSLSFLPIMYLKWQ